MRKLRLHSGGGPPKCELSEEQFRQLEAAIKAALPQSARHAIQGEVDAYLRTYSFYRASDAGPLLDFYQKAAEHFQRAADTLKAGPLTEDQNTKSWASPLFKSSRKYPHDPELAKVTFLAELFASNFNRAHERVLSEWSDETGPGVKRDEILVTFLARLADVLEGHGIKPSCNWNARYGEYRGRLIGLAKALFRMLPTDAQELETSLDTPVREALKRRRKQVRQNCIDP